MNHLTGFFILLCWATFFVFITLSAFSAKRTVEVAREWTWSWLGLVPFVAAFLLFRHTPRLLSYVRQMTLWPRTPLIGAAADFLTLAGLVIAVWGRIALGRNWSIHPGLKENHELIERGPYACVRHPMYSGLCLMFLGTVIWYGKGVGFLFFFACLFGTWLKLRREEYLLTKHFGQTYLEYKARVKALIPFLF